MNTRGSHTLRIIVWNMDHCIKGGQREKAWRWLEDSGADVAMLQESVPPDGLRSVVYRAIGGTRNWGSSIVGFTVDVEPVTSARGRAQSSVVDLVDSHPGTLAIGSIDVSGNPLTLVSAYGMIEDGYADTVVHRQLSDLAPLFDDATRGKRLIIGGDLNITTQWIDAQARYRRWEQTTFDRFAGFGLVDLLDRWRGDGPLEGCECADGDDCRHVRTQYHPRSDRPWQNDYAFATKALLDGSAVLDVRVIDNDEVRALSQHLPLMIDLR